MQRKIAPMAATLCLLVMSGRLLAQSSGAERSKDAGGVRVVTDIQYAVVDDHRLLLDLYLPTGVTHAALLVWVHGGAWRSGSKRDMPLDALVKEGYAVASVDYRLSTVARFPALVHDIKAAIRFLRAKETEYNYNARRIGILGSSAGGHLATLVGVTNGHKELEGSVGEHRDQSSAVNAIVDYYGPANFITILQQSTPHGLSVRKPAFELLLGGQPEDKPELAKLASPVYHVDRKDPPLLLIHGDQDPQVPINQSHELHGAYKRHELQVQFEVVHGGAHGGKGYFDEERTRVLKKYLDTYLRSDSSPKNR